MTEKFLSQTEVLKRTSLSRTTIWRHANAGVFPKPIHISARRVAWLESDIIAWQNDKIAKQLKRGSL